MQYQHMTLVIENGKVIKVDNPKTPVSFLGKS